MSDRPVIVADENIAAAGEAFSRYGEVRLLSGRAIDRAALRDADALVVRSITRVDRDLLEGTPVRFVGTATIGRDHLDEEYLWSRGITPVDAAGGAARSVAEYAVTASLVLRSRGLVDLAGDRIGVVGVGAIGEMVVDLLEGLDVKVVRYDPPRDEREEEFTSCSLEELVGCRLLILAVPLTDDGGHPTRHMIDAPFMDRLAPGTCIMNVARGGIVDTPPFAERLREGRLHGVVDVWEGEPEIDPDFLTHTQIATPHIAGYSRDGKMRGTEMMARGLARFLGRDDYWSAADALGPAGTIEVDPDLSADDQLLQATLTACPILRDDAALRSLFPLSPTERSAGFDTLRRTYPPRREFPAWTPTRENNYLERLGMQRRSRVEN